MIFEKKVREVRRTVDYIIVATRVVLIKNAEFIEDLNRDQLSRGERSDETLLPNYSPTSVAMGKPPGRIRLFDEGPFYEGINASIFDDEMRFEGEDEKTGMLISKYGAMILGLSDDSLQILIDKIKPEIIDEVRRFYKRI
jgi:hypothetical protein